MQFTAKFLRTAYGGTIDFATDPQWHDVFYGQPTPERVKELGRFLRSDPNRFVRLYHGTDASLPVMEKGLLPTSATRRRSFQSSPGYVYLSVFPGSAEDFGRMGNPGKPIRVYGVEVTIRRLCADTDQLSNKRYHAGMPDLGTSLAESLIHGHGARVKGKIDPMQVFIFKDTDRVQVKASLEPFSREAFNDRVLRNFKNGEAEDNGWKSPITVHHGTDSGTAQKIIAVGRFDSGADWPSFFIANRKIADDYSKIRTRQERERGKDVTPYVFSLRVDPWALHLNKGTNEIETHPSMPLYLRGNSGYIKDEDIIAVTAHDNPNDPVCCYEAYLEDFKQGGETSQRITTPVDGDVLVPVVNNGKVIGEKPLKEVAYWPLLSTYQYLKSKRDKKSRELLKIVETWGQQMPKTFKASLLSKVEDSSTIDAAFNKSNSQYKGLTPHEISHGHCYEWASEVAKNLPGAVVKDVDLWPQRGKADLPYHVWVEFQGKAYDAEVPQGVNNWRNLPFFKGHINQGILPKLKSRVFPQPQRKKEE